jgi:UDP-GlcNAc3NAcA epimerase
MKKIVTVVGARPQFVKAAAVSKVLRRNFKEYLVHTGQHYDNNMSDIFFKELNIPIPNENLNIGSFTHAVQTAKMMIKLEEVLLREDPALMIIYGDTNSTLAASIAASKIHIPVAHIESGLRNFDLTIPEEINRVIADKLSTYLFTPTVTAIDNLKEEGIIKNVFHSGDVMYDILLHGLDIADKKSKILSNFKLIRKRYTLVTIHRAENTDNVNNLIEIIKAIGEFQEIIIFPIHPRTNKVIDNNKIKIPRNVVMIPPVGYLDFITLEKNAKLIVTDSGGVQKEAYCLKVPCLTVFPSTSWVETVFDGWNKLVNAEKESILYAYRCNFEFKNYSLHYGNGNAASKIVEKLKQLI